MSVEFDDAYDEYFDSLTGSERNRALKPDARPQSIRAPKVTVPPKRHHWFILGVGYGMQIVGGLMEGVGQVVVWVGQGLQKWGRSMIV